MAVNNFNGEGAHNLRVRQTHDGCKLRVTDPRTSISGLCDGGMTCPDSPDLCDGGMTCPDSPDLCDEGTTCPDNPDFRSVGHTTRGNATMIGRWLLNTTGATINSYAQYDVAGNVVKTVEPLGSATTFGYTDRFGGPDGNACLDSARLELSSVGQTSYAFATSATNQLGHASYTQFDYYTGRPVDGEDANGIVSSAYSVDDLLDRPTRVVRAVNTSGRADADDDFQLCADEF